MELFGYVVDGTTKNGISGASISVTDDTGNFIGINTTAGGDGSFYLNDARIDPNSDGLYISAPGYNYAAYDVSTVATYNTAGEDINLQLAKAAGGSQQPGGGSSVTNAFNSLLSLFKLKTTPASSVQTQPQATQTAQISKIILPALLVAGAIIYLKKRKKRR